MSTIAIIPARMGSSRFPGKPLAFLHNMPMIGHVALRTKLALKEYAGQGGIDAVYVATCDAPIAAYCQDIDMPCIMTSSAHERCTARVAEALQYIENGGRKVENIVLVQGDEPMVTPSMIKAAMAPLYAHNAVQAVNLMAPISSVEEWQNANTIKVVVDNKGDSLYFSRAAIGADKSATIAQVPKNVYKQVCIMPFRRNFLLQFLQWQETPLERQESIDMLRLLEHGHKVRMVKIDERTQSVDTPEDLALVHTLMQDDALLPQYMGKICQA